jgi:hypothetical protein
LEWLLDILTSTLCLLAGCKLQVGSAYTHRPPHPYVGYHVHNNDFKAFLLLAYLHTFPTCMCAQTASWVGACKLAFTGRHTLLPLAAFTTSSLSSSFSLDTARAI